MTFNQFNTLVSDFMLGEWGTESGLSANTAFLKDDVLTMEFEVPGLSNEDIEVLVEDRMLEIKAEKEHRKFHKRYKIHDAFDINETSAVAKDGLLSIAIPKYEDRKARSIAVKVK
jgi:HSP20 family molecular chaperone IbpA